MEIFYKDMGGGKKVLRVSPCMTIDELKGVARNIIGLHWTNHIRFVFEGKELRDSAQVAGERYPSHVMHSTKGLVWLLHRRPSY